MSLKEKDKQWDGLHSRDHLESKRHNKGSITSQCAVRAKVDPKREHDTRGNEELVDASQTAADGSRRILGDVEGDEHGGSLGLLLESRLPRRA